MLVREFPDVVPDILTGVSAGGINAAYLAARQDSFGKKVERLAEMWSTLHVDDVFRVDLRDLTSRTVRWGGRLLSGGASPLPPAKSLVDTTPLRKLLERVLEAHDGLVDGVRRSLLNGWLQSIALTASSYTTGQSITWVQTRDDCVIPRWERADGLPESDRVGTTVEHEAVERVTRIEQQQGASAHQRRNIKTS